MKRRLALVFPGFEALAVEGHMRRFVREARKAAPLYGMDLAISEPGYDATGPMRTGSLMVSATGEGWSTETEIVIYDLGSCNALYAARNPLVRLVDGIVATADFAATGAAFAFFRTSWRFGVFYLYPTVLLLAALAAAFLALGVLPASVPAGVAALAGVAVLAGLIAAAERFFLLLVAFDLWTFSRDLARSRNPDVEARLSAIEADVRRRVAETDVDEVLFCAHSIGAVSAVRAAAASAGDGRPGLERGLLTAGSSLLQVGLHPRAAWLRSRVGDLTATPVAWLDAQSLTDPINFYRSDPAKALTGREAPGLRTCRVRFRDQLAPETYRAIKLNLFRVHRQFVFAVERRAHYSWHAIICGPERFADIRDRGGLSPAWEAQ